MYICRYISKQLGGHVGRKLHFIIQNIRRREYLRFEPGVFKINWLSWREMEKKLIKFSRLFFKERQGFQSCETAVVLSMCGPEKIFHHTTSYNAHLVNNAALKKITASKRKLPLQLVSGSPPLIL